MKDCRLWFKVGGRQMGQPGMARLETAALRVECYAGHRADERPLRFTLSGNVYDVVDVEDRWYSPGASFFRVCAGDGNRYVLRHDEGQDTWSLEAFRAAAHPAGGRDS